MASFPIVDGVGYFGAGGVLPVFRRRGGQTALISRRLAAAPGFGCDLVLGGGSPSTTTYRNFERSGGGAARRECLGAMAAYKGIMAAYYDYDIKGKRDP